MDQQTGKFLCIVGGRGLAPHPLATALRTAAKACL